MAKVGLIVEGGGMRGIYGCGVLDTFLENSISFPYGIGVSAGSANLASFIAEQEGRNFRFYTSYAFDERYMGFKNFVNTGSFFGMDYIYTELNEEVDPINFEKLINTNMEYYVVAVDAQTGLPVYFDKHAVAEYKGDVFKASSAIPAMCRPIEIDGKLYFDGGVSDSIPVKRALADGCDKVVAVLTRPKDYVKKPEAGKPIYSEMLKDYPAIIKAMNVRHFVYNSTLKYLNKLEDEGRALVFRPDNPDGVSIITRNKENLVTLYNEGRIDAEARLDELRAFISE